MGFRVLVSDANYCLIKQARTLFWVYTLNLLRINADLYDFSLEDKIDAQYACSQNIDTIFKSSKMGQERGIDGPQRKYFGNLGKEIMKDLLTHTVTN